MRLHHGRWANACRLAHALDHATGMRINLELLIASLAEKIRHGEIDRNSANLEDDLRGVILLHKVDDVDWHTKIPKEL